MFSFLFMSLLLVGENQQYHPMKKDLSSIAYETLYSSDNKSILCEPEPAIDRAFAYMTNNIEIFWDKIEKKRIE